MEYNVFGPLLEQQIFEMQEPFTLYVHVALKPVHKLLVFFSLKEQTQIRISFKRLEMVWLELEVFELFK